MTRIEYVGSQPKYSSTTIIPDADAGRVRIPYYQDGNWKYKDEATELSLVPYETFRSTETTYIDGAIVTFAHGWDNFNPAVDWYQAEPWAVCVATDSGWQPGDRMLLNNSGSTLSIDATNIYVQVGNKGITSGRKDGNLGEFSLNPASWLIYVLGYKKN